MLKKFYLKLLCYSLSLAYISLFLHVYEVNQFKAIFSLNSQIFNFLILKELHKASKILHKMILFQEDNIFIHHTNGGRDLIEEEDMLNACYYAMQVAG